MRYSIYIWQSVGSILGHTNLIPIITRICLYINFVITVPSKPSSPTDTLDAVSHLSSSPY
jgi:hypothetical protein